MAAGTDLFGGGIGTVTGMTAEGVTMTFSEFGSGLIIQSVDINYSQTITQLFALDDSSQMFLMAGRPSGDMKLTNIVGPGTVLGTFAEKYGNVCSMQGAFSISLSNGCHKGSMNGQNATVTLNSPVIQSIGLSVNTGDFKIVSSIGAVFTTMTISSK